MRAKIGKERDRIRRMGRAGWQAFGLRDKYGRLTPKARQRPNGRVRGVRDLRKRHLFDRDATRTENRAARYEGRANRSDGRADRHIERAARLKTAGRPDRARRADARAAAHRRRAARHRARLADAHHGHRQRYPERTR